MKISLKYKIIFIMRTGKRERKSTFFLTGRKHC